MSVLDIIEKDKLLHFIACETITMVVAIVLLFAGLGNWSFPIGFAVAFLVGICRELHDKKTTGLVDPWDIVFDFLGAFFGLIFVSLPVAAVVTL